MVVSASRDRCVRDAHHGSDDTTPSPPSLRSRVELFALLLARHNNIPAIVFRGGDASPYMISPTVAIPRAPGHGTFTCCARNHVMTDEHGVEKAIPCDKDKIGSVMFKLLSKRREYHLGNHELLEFRLWTALTDSIMQGLIYSDMQALRPTSVAAFLALNQFSTARDEENRGSGYTPLLFAAMSGNSPIVRELIDPPINADVRARVLVDVHDWGGERGIDALACAAAYCPQCRIHDVIAILIAAGADPNGSARSGFTPLMAAVGGLNTGGVSALLRYGELDLEKGLLNNNAGALNLAAFMSTFEIVKALIEAGADTSHLYVGGG